MGADQSLFQWRFSKVCTNGDYADQADITQSSGLCKANCKVQDSLEKRFLISKGLSMLKKYKILSDSGRLTGGAFLMQMNEVSQQA